MRTIVDFDLLELGLVVNLQTLRDVLSELSVSGRRWWIACDPVGALESSSLTVGHGDKNCVDRLNTLYFNIPVLSNEMPMAGINRLLLLLDSSVISAEEPGMYLEHGLIMWDGMTDIESFLEPIRSTLIAKLQCESSSNA